MTKIKAVKLNERNVHGSLTKLSVIFGNSA